MTDLSPSDDELLSSFLDGELTDDEAARLNTRLTVEPALRSRLDALRQAADLAATPVPPLDAATSDSLVATALAAGASPPGVTDLGTARSARRTRRGARLAAAAAVVLVVGASIPLLANLSDSDDADTASSGSADADATTAAVPADTEDTREGDGADDMTEAAELDSAGLRDDDGGDDGATDDAAGDDGSGAGGDTSDAGDGTSAAPSYAAVFGDDVLADALGGFPTTDALRAAVVDRYEAHRARVVEGGPTSTQHAEDVESATNEAARADFFARLAPTACAAEIRDLEDTLAPIVAADYATAAVDGAKRAVLLYAQEGDDAVAFLVDLASCTVDEVPLDPGG